MLQKRSAAFIHDLLKFHKVQNPESVKIKLGPNYISGNNTIVIEWLFPGSSVSHLESLIYHYNNQELFPDYNFENLLNQIHHNIGSIEHEISHIKNKDCKKHALTLAAFSIVSYLSLKLFLRKKYLSIFLLSQKLQKMLHGNSKQPMHSLQELHSILSINMRATGSPETKNEAPMPIFLIIRKCLIAKINQHMEIHDGLQKLCSRAMG